MKYRSKTKENASFYHVKSVCHEIVLVKGGRANADGGGQKMKKDDRRETPLFYEMAKHI